MKILDSVTKAEQLQIHRNARLPRKKFPILAVITFYIENFTYTFIEKTGAKRIFFFSKNPEGIWSISPYILHYIPIVRSSTVCSIYETYCKNLEGN